MEQVPGGHAPLQLAGQVDAHGAGDHDGHLLGGQGLDHSVAHADRAGAQGAQRADMAVKVDQQHAGHHIALLHDDLVTDPHVFIQLDVAPLGEVARFDMDRAVVAVPGGIEVVDEEHELLWGLHRGYPELFKLLLVGIDISRIIVRYCQVGFKQRFISGIDRFAEILGQNLLDHCLSHVSLPPLH